ncbi:hypothetical protein CEXT_669201 [Caerostris extrusa]|uniref:Uncharacterized protein n=1 Tax=Caerostris extrusa TaxID=172846 RepID=A0AAV4MI36_CAEEX|nr:hypothetical protein CEXT_669201 [Caerostris extrusa]
MNKQRTKHDHLEKRSDNPINLMLFRLHPGKLFPFRSVSAATKLCMLKRVIIPSAGWQLPFSLCEFHLTATANASCLISHYVSRNTSSLSEESEKDVSTATKLCIAERVIIQVLAGTAVLIVRIPVRP